MPGVAFYVALFFTCVPFIFLCVRVLRSSWDNKNDQVYEALRSPSVRNARNAFDRRVALAIREARQGFRTCGGCQFTNTSRATSCVMCGAAMPRPPKSVLSRFKTKRPQPSREIEAAPADIGFENASLRQRRVLLRKLWARQVDHEGRVVWHCTAISGAAASTFPSYVLQTTRVVPTAAADEAEGEPAPQPAAPRPLARHASHHDESEGNNDNHADHVAVQIEVGGSEASEQPPEPTVPMVTSRLEQQLAQQKLEIVEVSEANPSLIAFSSNNASASSTADQSPTAVADEFSPPVVVTQSLADTANIAQLDFPSKIAQFITSVASLFNDLTKAEATSSSSGIPVSRFSIQREALLADSITALATMPSSHVRGAIRVEFVNEQGIDAGGVYREWCLLLNEAIITPDAGIFSCVDQQAQTFYLNPRSRDVLGEHHLAHFFAAGRLLGRALLEGNVTGFHLALPLLKIMLGLPVSFSDLEYFDPEVYRNLVWFLEHDGVDALGLDFTSTEQLADGTTREVELVPGGSTIDVTDANKRDYVDAKLKYLLVGSVQQQLFAFLTGVYEVVPAELLMVFDAEELDYVLSGSDEIDVDDWEAHTLVSRNLALHPAYFNFWIVVRELSAQQRQRLLQYATGSTRVPPGGFSALTSHDGRLCLFSLRGGIPAQTWGCLHAHACFNRLDVPLHRELDAMREAVLAAVSSQILGFTTA